MISSPPVRDEPQPFSTINYMDACTPQKEKDLDHEYSQSILKSPSLDEDFSI